VSKTTTGSKKDSAEQTGGIERRRARRRPIIETFSIFCIVPKKGVHRLQIHDLSENGIGFDLDTEGEEPGAFPLKSGDQLDLHFYLNQSLYLPISVRVARIEERNQLRRIGAEFNTKDKGFQAIAAFLKLLDAIVDVAQIQSGVLILLPIRPLEELICPIGRETTAEPRIRPANMSSTSARSALKNSRKNAGRPSASSSSIC
jgi:hypothetical protein